MAVAGEAWLPPALPSAPVARPVSDTTTTTPPPAAPSAAAPDTAPGFEQRLGAAALARISYPWARLGYSITFLGPRSGLLGGTLPGTHSILLFVRPGEDVSLLAHVIAHEIGHAVDKTYNTGARRQRWLELRGVSVSTPWFTCDRCADFTTGAGDFAETFAVWQVGPPDHSRVAPAPPPAQLAPLVWLFEPSS